MKKPKEIEAFFDYPKEGKLPIEHSLYLLNGEPVLFVCKNKKGNRFLCSRYQAGQKWFTGQIEDNSLLDLIEGKIAIQEAMQQCCSKWIVSRSGDNIEYHGAFVPCDVLPQIEIPLGSVHDSSYIEKLIRDCNSCKGNPLY